MICVAIVNNFFFLSFNAKQAMPVAVPAPVAVPVPVMSTPMQAGHVPALAVAALSSIGETSSGTGKSGISGVMPLPPASVASFKQHDT